MRHPVLRARRRSSRRAPRPGREPAANPPLAPLSPDRLCTESVRYPVIPGRRPRVRASRGPRTGSAVSPEPINTDLWNMGSGPAASRHPGMTSPESLGRDPRLAALVSIDFGALLDELLRLFGHAALGIVADFLGDLHRAEFGAAHRAEMRELGT